MWSKANPDKLLFPWEFPDAFAWMSWTYDKVLTVKLQCPLQMCPVHFMMLLGFSMFSIVVCHLSLQNGARHVFVVVLFWCWLFFAVVTNIKRKSWVSEQQDPYMQTLESFTKCMSFSMNYFITNSKALHWVLQTPKHIRARQTHQIVNKGQECSMTQCSL